MIPIAYEIKGFPCASQFTMIVQRRDMSPGGPASTPQRRVRMPNYLRHSCCCLVIRLYHWRNKQEPPLNLSLFKGKPILLATIRLEAQLSPFSDFGGTRTRFSAHRSHLTVGLRLRFMGQRTFSYLTYCTLCIVTGGPERGI